jgi:hypothetical protein
MTDICITVNNTKEVTIITCNEPKFNKTFLGYTRQQAVVMAKELILPLCNSDYVNFVVISQDD